MRITVGFNRDRDGYQVPLALAEVGALERLVTDYYVGSGLQLSSRLPSRRVAGLPAALVTTSPAAFAAQAGWDALRRLHPNLPFPSALVDGLLARKIARSIRADTSDLLLYAGYALPAFKASPSRTKVLYEYHPGTEVVRRGLAADQLRDQVKFVVKEPEEKKDGRGSHLAEERALANGFIVSSSFTASGLLDAGVAPDRIRIVPYGIDLPDSAGHSERAADGPVQFLFVGQGIRRKGLHTLLEAWRAAELADAELTVVCYRIDDAIARIADGQSGVRILPKQTDGELAALYERTDYFVLPSLVEGFGLVLLEALARGCRVIASTNTGLPDLGLPDSMGRIVQAGDVSALADALRRAAADGSLDENLRAESRRAAGGWSWERYRSAIVSAFSSFAGADASDG